MSAIRELSPFQKLNAEVFPVSTNGTDLVL
jgi:hypothetical protein